VLVRNLIKDQTKLTLELILDVHDHGLQTSHLWLCSVGGGVTRKVVTHIRAQPRPRAHTFLHTKKF
jgi:hypothetical protein